MDSEKTKEYNHKCTHQRAAIMAVIHKILTMSDDKPSKDAKLIIASVFKDMIELNIMVYDEIDFSVISCIKEYLNQEQAFRAANNIVNPENPL